MSAVQGTKSCTGCGETKSVCDFNRDSRLKCGLKSKCRLCDNAIAAAWRKANPEAFKKSYTNWRSENKDRVARVAKAWYDRDPEARHAEAAAAYLKNRDEWRARNAAWCKANRHRRAATCARYLAAKLQRTPVWADHAKINEVYRQAQFLIDIGVAVHVDHVIPLQGKTVSGLHVHNNLRVLLAEDNMSKGNKLLPEFAGEP